MQILRMGSSQAMSSSILVHYLTEHLAVLQMNCTDFRSVNRPSEFNPPAGWYTGQSGSGSSGSQTQTSAASASLRPLTLFRLLTSSLGTNARRIARPQVYPSQLDSQHPTFGPHTPSEWPPGAIPSVETPPTTPVLLPPSWSLLSRLLVSALPAPARSAVIPRKPVETPPTEYLPYLPPPNYDWPAGENPGNEYPQPSEFNPPAGWYGGIGSGGSSSAPGTVSPANNGAVLASGSGHSPALSAGAIAGISVGGSVLLVLVTWFIWRRRKINKRKKAEGGGELPMSEAD